MRPNLYQVYNIKKLSKVGENVMKNKPKIILLFISIPFLYLITKVCFLYLIYFDRIYLYPYYLNLVI